MIGEERRGSVLEQSLSKLLYKGSCQVVGMSATLSSVERLKKFLSAYVYQTDFRPVQLNEYMKMGTQLFKYDTESEGYAFEKEVKRMVRVVV